MGTVLVVGAGVVVGVVVVGWAIVFLLVGAGPSPNIAPSTNKTPKTARVILSHFGNRLFRGCAGWGVGCIQVFLFRATMYRS
ncbi:hypothetical protein [Amycolatopsis sp. lyj-108]|uniref:hypothetical protein n=1 Tax=Amycolatopsis sp. lyj-108 TaxID=2789286 RepID=UPI00397D62BC